MLRGSSSLLTDAVIREAQRILHHIAHRWPMGCKCEVCLRVDRHHLHVAFDDAERAYRGSNRPPGGQIRAARSAPRAGMSRSEGAENKAGSGGDDNGMTI